MDENRKLHIMEVISGGGHVNGVVTHCMLLTRALASQGHRVTLLHRPNPWLAGQLSSDGVHLIESRLKRWPPSELRQFAAYIREEGVDVIHTHMTGANNFGLFLQLISGAPWVPTTQSISRHFNWRFAEQVIAVSEATRQVHIRRNGVKPERIRTVRNFVDCDALAKISIEARAATRAELKVDDATVLLGTVGDVIPRKGQLHLVRAFRKIVASHPNTRLAIIGNENISPGYVLEVKAEVERLGLASQVLWTGFRADVSQLIAALDIYVLATDDEACCMSIVEAMAAGIPVVTTSVGGNPELVQTGETGILVPNREPEVLAKAILPLIDNSEERRRMAQAGQEKARREFSLQPQASATADVLRYAASKKRRR